MDIIDDLKNYTDEQLSSIEFCEKIKSMKDTDEKFADYIDRCRKKEINNRIKKKRRKRVVKINKILK